MPDPARKTISASQSPALFNASPYVTRWMLYHFLRGAPEARAETDRMAWGKKMQPLVLQQAQLDLKVEVFPNFTDTYLSDNNLLGYTSDALIRCPDRGAGTVEAKCVFDYGVWMREWAGGKQPPKHYELQLQHQLTVGDGEKPFPWGVIAAWVCGEMHYFERRYDPAVGEAIRVEARMMMAAVSENIEPSAFGSGIEAPILNTLFPPVPGKVLDLSADESARPYSQLAAMFKQFRADKTFYEKAADEAKAKLRTLARDHETVLLPGGVKITVTQRTIKAHERKESKSTVVNVFVPEQTDETPEILKDE